MSHFYGATDTPVTDFWWRLIWVSSFKGFIIILLIVFVNKTYLRQSNMVNSIFYKIYLKLSKLWTVLFWLYFWCTTTILDHLQSLFINLKSGRSRGARSVRRILWTKNLADWRPLLQRILDMPLLNTFNETLKHLSLSFTVVIRSLMEEKQNLFTSFFPILTSPQLVDQQPPVSSQNVQRSYLTNISNHVFDHSY